MGVCMCVRVVVCMSAFTCMYILLPLQAKALGTLCHYQRCASDCK